MPAVEIIRAVDINLLAVVITAILLIIAAFRHDQNRVERILFILLCTANIILNILEISGYILDTSVGMPGGSRGLSILVHMLAFALSAIPVAVWMIYTQYQLFSNARRFRQTIAIVAAICLANALMAALSVRTGWYFTVDSSGAYHRGDYYFVHMSVNYMILAVSCLIVVAYRHRLERRIFVATLLFGVPPLLGSILQMLFYGLMLNWVSMTVSLLIIYFHIQNKSLITDYLTGTYNRRHFEHMIHDKIRHCAACMDFAVILADIDRFKQINDQYGHTAGDDALKIAVKIIRSVLRQNDTIARCGGDEFFIVLNFCGDSILDIVIKRVYAAFERFNRNSGLPYRIEMSLGGDIFSRSRTLTAEQFLLNVDQLMYQEKTRRLNLLASGSPVS